MKEEFKYVFTTFKLSNLLNYLIYFIKFQARIASNKESIRKGIWMKMLSSSAQTLPLYVGKLGEKPPPLCGAIPADPNYIAKVGIWLIFPCIN